MAQHRPTWNPAVGKVKSHGLTSFQVSAKDQIGETQLKFRQLGQSSKEDMARINLVEELEKREMGYLSDKNKIIAMIESEEKKVSTLLIKNSTEEVVPKKTTYNDDDIVLGDENVNDFSSSDEEDDEDDDDEEDDEEELQRELEKIKAERALTQKKKEEEERKMNDERDLKSAMFGNPLINLGADVNSTKVKRMWNDDVVFKNQTRTEPELKKRFINDTIRNDFHKSFLKKYMH